MSVKTRLQHLPLFWKVYAFVVLLFIAVVSLVEVVLEPPITRAFERMYGAFLPWQEAVLWAGSILIPSLACGFVISKVLSVKLGRMVHAANALARGNLEIRLPFTNNEKDAFDHLSRSFNAMADAIKTQRQHERRLLADISHELRSPLTRIAVTAELMAQERTPEQNLMISRCLNKDVALMNGMVSMLLAQAKSKVLDAEHTGPVELTGLLRDLCDDFRLQGENKRISIQAEIADALVTFGSTSQYTKMIGNVFSNAIFYSPEQGVVDVRASLAGEKILVTIRDHGPGVPEDQLQDIFRAFYRVDNSRARSSGGVGLGLALAREAALQYGGDIRAANARPGLQVTMTLPIHEAAPAA